MTKTTIAGALVVIASAIAPVAQATAVNVRVDTAALSAAITEAETVYSESLKSSKNLGWSKTELKKWIDYAKLVAANPTKYENAAYAQTQAGSYDKSHIYTPEEALADVIPALKSATMNMRIEAGIWSDLESVKSTKAVAGGAKVAEAAEVTEPVAVVAEATRVAAAEVKPAVMSAKATEVFELDEPVAPLGETAEVAGAGATMTVSVKVLGPEESMKQLRAEGKDVEADAIQAALDAAEKEAQRVEVDPGAEEVASFTSASTAGVLSVVGAGMISGMKGNARGGAGRKGKK